MKLSQLHESFIEKARRPMTFGNLPIKPTENDLAIIPVDRWKETKEPHRLHKQYRFLSQESRNAFVGELLQYEQETQHNAEISIEECVVKLTLYTKDVDRVTELDKSYAKIADIIFKDIVYNPPDGI